MWSIGNFIQSNFVAYCSIYEFEVMMQTFA